MIRWFALLTLLALPQTGWAEVVRVRSGEHEDFSRLLLEFREGVEWEFGRVEGGFEFRSHRDDFEYDLRKAFDLIPRTRIGDLIDLGNGRLFVSLACDCHGDAFDLRQGQVVLDIKNGPASAQQSIFEARLDPIEPMMQPLGTPDNAETVPTEPTEDLRRSAVERRAGLPLMLPPAVQPRAPLPMIQQQNPPSVDHTEQPEPLTPANTPVPTSNLSPDEFEARVEDNQATPNRVSETESALLAQIARAAAQGLLDADLGKVEEEVARATNPSIDLVPDPAETQPRRDPLPPITPRGHISIETSVDRAFGAGAVSPVETDIGNPCIDAELVDVANWGEPMDDGADLGEYRSRIVGEFDIANGEGITDLARHYVYITFGAEAKALVGRYPNDVTRGDLLVAMAEIVDNGFSDSAMDLLDQMACDGPSALWAALAQPQIYRGQSINAAAISLAFAGLPPHLRRHLGPGLGEKFLAIGDTQTADLIRNAVERSDSQPNAALGLLTARFDLASGDIAAATEHLDEIVKIGDETLPDALIERVEATLGAGLPVPSDLISLVSSVAFERRGTELGATMIELEVRALASASNFDAAFSRILDSRSVEALSANRLAALRAEVFSAVATEAGDVEFLRLATLKMREAVRLPPEDRRRIAERFLSLGFSRPARQVLGGEGALPETADRLFFAQAALLEGNPEVAIGYLAGLNDEPANRLRAEALAAAEDHIGAVRAFGVIGDANAQRRVAWQGGLWDAVAALDEGPERDVARLMTGADQGDLAVSADSALEDTILLAPIAQSQALIDSSKAARGTLEALLIEIQSPLTESVQ